MFPLVGLHSYRRETLGEPDSFLQGFLDFLVIERVGGTIDEPFPVSDCGATPRLKQFQIRGARPSLSASLRSARMARA